MEDAESRPIHETPDFLEDLFYDLAPVMRSITGPGFRESLEILREHIPLTVEHVQSGTSVFDWEIPQEWRIEEAYLEGPDGTRYASLNKSNLAVVNYSQPVDRHLSLEELESHLHTVPDLPHARPYVTSYYERSWGFCLPHETYEALPEGEYHAYIDSRFVDGELTYGHTTLEGKSDREFLLSTYLCHPTMANNELSGPLVLTALYNLISQWDDHYYTYRFLVNPETIGSLTYLSEHGEHLREDLDAGMVLTCLGGPRKGLSYQRTRRGTATLDRLATHLERTGPVPLRTRPFDPTGGSDERQYCSPGFNLPVGQVARTVYEEYDEYHTSADTKEFMDISQVTRSVEQLETFLRLYEYAGHFRNTKPYGEPKLSEYDLYPTINSPETWTDSTDEIINDDRELLDKILTILNYSDGQRSMVQIAEDNDFTLDSLTYVIDILQDNGLLVRYEEEK